jgi:hypothetical protein
MIYRIEKTYPCLMDRPIIKIKVYFIYDDRWLDCNALWDTGTTNTLISKSFVKKYNLTPKYNAKVLSAGEKEIKIGRRYLVNLFLSDELYLKEIMISSFEMHEADILIGMDIIKYGDLRIRNIDNKTVLTFLCNKT